jgi:catechol 2,3-dioxygenase-like lactoylglutathione lyase family enzyme
VGENLEVFDHVTVGVSDLAASLRFYDAALAPLCPARYEAGEFGEWGDLSIAAGRPVIENARIVLVAPTAAASDPSASCATGRHHPRRGMAGRPPRRVDRRGDAGS